MERTRTPLSLRTIDGLPGPFYCLSGQIVIVTSASNSGPITTLLRHRKLSRLCAIVKYFHCMYLRRSAGYSPTKSDWNAS
ncbi:hypothetical protein FGADI_12007 [Fusarium gaditjirri]|uniref:Uncharacterized protein n=1 Tax=Fusarium gaditjirri TaxID=282569 RepID=A0A8H4STI8_9HYPO|nr:hypothetical protein FGADI_12007 [Fusarium gaditjirri]